MSQEVLARARYGVSGSNLPALMETIIACGWFGINAWIGGQAVYTLIKAVVPAADAVVPAIAGHTLVEWRLNIFVIYHGMEVVKKLESWATPFIFAMTAILVVWTVSKDQGFGSLMSDPGKFQTVVRFLPIFIPSVAAMIG